MKSLVIARREILEILKNKRLLLAFLFQTLAVVALLPAFSDFLSQGNLAFPVPSLAGFVPLAVVDYTGGEISELLKEDKRLTLTFFDSPEEAGEGFAGLLLAEKKEGQFFLTLYLRENIKAELLQKIVREDIASLESELMGKKLEILNLSDKPEIEIEREFLKKTVVQRGERKYSSFFLSYLVPLVLLFPLFFSGSLVMDSVVGEKDRKTLEPLVSSPVPREDIVRGKFLGIWSILFSQAVLWFMAMKLLSIPVANSAASLFLLATLLALVVALAILQAMLSENIKEANISMMVFYIFLFIAIIVTLSLDFFIPSRIFEYLPVSLFARVISGGSFSPESLLVSSAFTMAVAVSALRAAEKLIYRDDIVFGGRVSIINLASEALDSYFSFFESRRPGGTLLFLVLVSPLSFGMALSFELLSGFIIFFLLGFSKFSIGLGVLLFAFFEELLKPLALYPLKLRGWLQWRSSLLAGVIAGVLFFSLETLAMSYLLEFHLLGSFYSFLGLRLFTTLIMHSFTGAIAGLWLYSGRLRYLAIAVLIHTFFNLSLVGVSL